MNDFIHTNTATATTTNTATNRVVPFYQRMLERELFLQLAVLLTAFCFGQYVQSFMALLAEQVLATSCFAITMGILLLTPKRPYEEEENTYALYGAAGLMSALSESFFGATGLGEIILNLFFLTVFGGIVASDYTKSRKAILGS